MNRSQREEYLADVHVGVVSLTEPGRGPLAIPIWYDYEAGGDLRFLTEKGSRKGKLLSEGVRISVCAQDEQPPYRYVSVEGPIVSIESADIERDVRPMARRYLGREGGDRYTESEGAPTIADTIVVVLKPERWLSADYGDE